MQLNQIADIPGLLTTIGNTPALYSSTAISFGTSLLVLTRTGAPMTIWSDLADMILVYSNLVNFIVSPLNLFRRVHKDLNYLNMHPKDVDFLWGKV